METSAAAPRMEGLETRRLFALAGAGTSTVTGTDFQSVDKVVPISGGYVVAGLFGANTDFGNGKRVAPRGATDLFISVVKGSSASLLTLGGGDSADEGKLSYKHDRADFDSAPERSDDKTFQFPVSTVPGKADEVVTSMKLGPDGKLYVAIAFRHQISLDTQAKHAATLTATSEFDNKFYDSAVLRYTINGANLKLDRTLQIGGPFNDIIRDMDFASDGDLIVAGSFERRCDFQPGKGTDILNPDGRDDAFVARYDSGNKLQWVRQFGGGTARNDEAEATNGIAVSGGSVYAGGTFAGKAEFDRTGTVSDDNQHSNSSTHVQLKAKDATDGFTLKLNAQTGALDWVRSQGGNNLDGVQGVALAPGGGVYNVGYFQRSADLDPSATSERKFDATNDKVESGRGEDTDAFFTRLDSKGNLVWVKPLSGTGRELVSSINSTASGQLTIAGSFAGELDADPSSGEAVLESTKVDIDDKNGNRDHAYAGFVAVFSDKGTFRRATQLDGQREQDAFINSEAVAADGSLLIGGRYRGGFTLNTLEGPFRVTTQKEPSNREDGFALSFFDVSQVTAK